MNLQDTASKVDLKDFVTFRISRTHAALNRQAMQTLSEICDLGLTQWRILSIFRMKGTTTASEVAKYAYLDKGQISRAVKGLRSLGLVEDATGSDDHRLNQLKLTEAGRSEYDRIVETMRKRQKMLVQDVTEAELETFRHVLEKIERRAGEVVR